MYEPAERVTMMIAGPGIAAGQTISNLTSLLDVFPTLLEMAGGRPSDLPALEGASLFPLMARAAAREPERYPADRMVGARAAAR